MRGLFLNIGLFSVLGFFAQSFTEPSKIKSFNVTVNFPDYTVKTQMLNHTKSFEPKSDLTYMWYEHQKIMETKGGFDGKLIHGTYRSFYLNNQLKEKGEIRYGLKNSKWKYWYNNGNIRESITWKDGTKNGTYCIFNDDGKLMAKGNFKNDKLHGRFYTYDINGKVLEKKRYKEGTEVLKKVKVKKEPKVKKIKEPKDEKKKEPKPKKEKLPKKKKSEDSESDKITEV
ncbi:MAG: toxin-antitoxin system YwqK family antitoxin [Sphingobacteriaceae bacterium]|jgi:hypothetical protein